MRTDCDFPNAVVVLANHATLTADGPHPGYRCVRSRMLLWCRAGSGCVRVNRRKYGLLPDRFLLLPWNHSVQYKPESGLPFVLGGVHIIPDHAHDKPLVLQVAHEAGHPLYDCPWRSDAPGLPDQVVEGDLTNHPAVRHLAEAAVALHQENRLDRAGSAELASLILANALAPASRIRRPEPAHPHALFTAVTHARRHLDQPLTVPDLARIAGCAPSTLTRLFKRHLGMPPMEWIIRRRIDRASALLLTTRKRIGRIAAQVGIDNPYYFSRLFKRTTGLTPTEYRARRLAP